MEIRDLKDATLEQLLGKLRVYAKDFSIMQVGLYETLMPVDATHKEYLKGIVDGAENAIIPAYIEGARQMFKLLTKDETDTNKHPALF